MIMSFTRILVNLTINIAIEHILKLILKFLMIVQVKSTRLMSESQIGLLSRSQNQLLIFHRKFDCDGSGTIDTEELGNLIRVLG